MEATSSTCLCAHRRTLLSRSGCKHTEERCLMAGERFLKREEVVQVVGKFSSTLENRRESASGIAEGW